MQKKKRKVCVFSGKRGGLGAYVPLMQLIEADKDLELQILLGDMHASKEFGRTVQEVENFFCKSKIEIVEMDAGRGDSSLIRTENLGLCLQNCAGILNRLEPDILMVHGDRGEHLMAAFAALNLGIPVTHSQGGDISGNIDDIQRQAITKLAHIHFPETENSAQRIRRMGEEEWRIHPVGSLYIDRIVKKMYTPFEEIQKKYGVDRNDKYFIIIFHPDTFESRENNYYAAKNIFKAVRSFGLKSFVIYPCSDPGYEGILRAIEEVQDDEQFLIHKNIDNLDFLSLMEQAQVIIGNSSCALVEAPYFHLPAINIGNRQLDREREGNVVDAKPVEQDIVNKIKFVLLDKEFRGILASCGKRLGDGRASEKILEVLKNIKIDKKLLRKRMTY